MQPALERHHWWTRRCQIAKWLIQTWPYIDCGLPIADLGSRKTAKLRLMFPQSAILNPQSPQSSSFLSHREIKHSISGVERRPDRAINRASADRAAPEHLNISRFKLCIHQDGDQVLAQSVDAIQVRERASEPVFGCLLYCFQSSLGS